jgi:ribosome-binding ATPase YchF (GTP1/OBG family)
VAAHSFFTNKPNTLATPEEVQNPDVLMVRAFNEAGYICFLSVDGKENRAWPIRNGTSAWDATGSIHSDTQKGFN